MDSVNSFKTDTKIFCSAGCLGRYGYVLRKTKRKTWQNVHKFWAVNRWRSQKSVISMHIWGQKSRNLKPNADSAFLGRGSGPSAHKLKRSGKAPSAPPVKFVEKPLASKSLAIAKTLSEAVTQVIIWMSTCARCTPCLRRCLLFV